MVAPTDDLPQATAASSSSSSAKADDVHLTLYYHRYSYYSQKVLLALYEKRLNFELREIDITRGEQYGAWFLGLNPRGEVPVLKDGDKIIPESVRIIDYLEDHFTGDGIPSLLPSDPSIKQKILELRKTLDQLPGNVLTVGSFHHKEYVDKPKLPFIGPVRWLLSRAEEKSAETLRLNAEKIPAACEILLRKAAAQDKAHEIIEDPDKFNAALAQVDKALEKVVTALKPGPWLGGDKFTVADVSLAVVLERMSGLGLDTKLWGERPEIKNYYDRLKDRESFNSAVPRGWLPLISLTRWQPPLAAATAVLSTVVAGIFILSK